MQVSQILPWLSLTLLTEEYIANNALTFTNTLTDSHGGHHPISFFTVATRCIRRSNVRTTVYYAATETTDFIIQWATVWKNKSYRNAVSSLIAQ